MKQLTCEMCGSTDLMKQEGVFVCQNCGTKYSVEEAKKMMIEGTVEVQGTVKVDSSDIVKKSLINARGAYQNEDWESAEKYYSLVKQDMPNNLEVVFFHIYCRAMNQLYGTDYFSREQTFNALLKLMPLLNELYKNTAEDKQILKEANKALQKMYGSNFVRLTYETSGTGSYQWQKNLFKAIDNAFIAELKNINQKYHEQFITEFITERFQAEQKLQREKEQREAAIRKSNTGAKVGAVIGGIIGAIIGIWLCNLTMDTIRTPIGRLNNPPQNDWFIMIFAFGAPALLGVFIGALIGSAIANKKK